MIRIGNKKSLLELVPGELNMDLGMPLYHPKFLSPSSWMLFCKDKREWALKYLLKKDDGGALVPKLKQTEPMALGGAFDCRVKSYLVERIYGSPEGYHAPGYDFISLFEAAVDEENRDLVEEKSADVFAQYQASGALANLMFEVERADSDIYMETTVHGFVGEVPVMGKPDLHFSSGRVRVIDDWKVNGVYAKRRISPKKNYLRLWDSEKPEVGYITHKACMPAVLDGFGYDMSTYFEDIAVDWATQIAVYDMILGGDHEILLAGIEQVCGGGDRGLRFAAHRGRISPGFSETVQAGFSELWNWTWDLDELRDIYTDYAGHEDWFNEMVRE